MFCQSFGRAAAKPALAEKMYAKPDVIFLIPEGFFTVYFALEMFDASYFAS
jgi:hypothetical protein